MRKISRCTWSWMRKKCLMLQLGLLQVLLPLAEAVAESAAGPPARTCCSWSREEASCGTCVAKRALHDPAILQRLAPPGMSFGLDQKAHRFTIKFKIEALERDKCGLLMDQVDLAPRTFQHMSWEEALKQLHQEAWERWDLAKHLPGFELDDPNQAAAAWTCLRQHACCDKRGHCTDASSY